MVNNSRAKPLYELEQLRTLVQVGKVHLANRRVQKNLLSLGWKSTKLHALLCCLGKQHFQRSHEGMSAYDGAIELDVDVYKMCFDEANDREGSPSRDFIFYMKLALRTLPSGDVVAVVSFHPDGQP